jgi:hypothetical protein
MLSKTPLHQLVDRTCLEPWRKALLDAADLIETGGHTKYQYRSGGSYCAIGALAHVNRVDCWGLQFNISKVKGALELEHHVKSSFIAEWNDAPERTPAEVMGAMRECALKGVM